MQQKFEAVLLQHGWHNQKILVAVSGGADSMVLAALLHRAGMTMAVVHCNFGLRGAESDGDEQLVRDWAAQHHIPCYVKHFDTRGLLAEEGGNLQETARDLRYQWFETLRQETGYDLIATAHHRQDSVETLVINFFKGTGIAGLHGILPRQQRIIRPLLAFTKEALLAFAVAHHIPWREDSSNKKEDYTRNAVRHRLLPLAEELFPGAVSNLAGNTVRLGEAEMLYREAIERYRKKLIEQRNKDWYIPVLKLRHVKPLPTILWELLRPFSFQTGQLPDALHLLEAETGRYIRSGSHRLVRNRNFLIVTPLAEQHSSHILLETGTERVVLDEFRLEINYTRQLPDAGHLQSLTRQELLADLDQLQFPLVLRPWKTGDYFYPLGMGRKKKKVSRFLISEKVPLHEKEKVWVLESGKKIVWVVGMRADERFKVTANTVNCGYFSVKAR